MKSEELDHVREVARLHARIVSMKGAIRMVLKRWEELDDAKLNKALHDLRQCYDFWEKETGHGESKEQSKEV